MARAPLCVSTRMPALTDLNLSDTALSDLSVCAELPKLERLDVSGERQQIELDGKQPKGRFYDFAAANKALSPGGIYSAKFRSSQIVFQVDAHARPGTTPIVGRLVRMD